MPIIIADARAPASNANPGARGAEDKESKRAVRAKPVIRRDLSAASSSWRSD
jgi:hypothetical protein